MARKKKKNIYEDWGLGGGADVDVSGSDNPYESWGSQVAKRPRDPAVIWDWGASTKDELAKQTADKEAEKKKVQKEAGDRAKETVRKRGVWEKFGDVFEANSPQDQQKRMDRGEAKTYEQQQKDKINPPQTTNADRDETVAMHEALNQRLKSGEIDQAGYAKEFTKTLADRPNPRREITPTKEDIQAWKQSEVQKVSEKLRAGKINQPQAVAIIEGITSVDEKQLTAQDLLRPDNPRSSVGQALGAFGGSVGTSVLSIPGDVASLAGGAIEATTPFNSAGQRLQKVGKASDETMDVLSGYSTGARPGENSFVVNLGSGAGSLAFSLAAATLGSPTTAATLFGVKAGAEQYRAVREEGKSNLQGLVTAIPAGIAEAGLEKIGLDKFLGAGGSPVRKFITRMVTEGAQELTQSAAQSTIGATYKDTDWTKVVQQAATEGMYGALVGGGGDIALEISPKLVQAGLPQQLADKIANRMAGSAEQQLAEDQGAEKATETPHVTVENQIAEYIKTGEEPTVEGFTKYIEEAGTELTPTQLNYTIDKFKKSFPDTVKPPATETKPEVAPPTVEKPTPKPKGSLKPITPKPSVPEVSPAKQAVKDGLTEEQFMKGQGTYFHSTPVENVSKIEANGFSGDIGKMSQASGGKMEKGVFLYDKKSSADTFGKNFKSASTIETKVNGKVYDANTQTKYGWEDDLQTQEIAKDPKIIAQLKRDGFVGVKSTELGTNATFVFEPSAVKTTSQLRAEYQQASPTPKPKVTPQKTTPPTQAKPKGTPKPLSRADIAKEEGPTAETAQDRLDKARLSVESGGYVGTIPKPVNKSRLGRLLRKKGVEVVDQPRRTLGSVLGVTPMRELGKKDPVAGQIFQAGRNAQTDYEAMVDEGRQHSAESFKGLKEAEKTELVKLQEEGISEAEVKKLKPKYRKAIEGMRWFNAEIRKIAETEFDIDTSQWRFDTFNYFHHLFIGDQAVVVDGHVKFIGRRGPALQKAEELINSGVDPKNITIKPKFMKENAPTTLLSQKGFWSFVTKMADKLEVSSTEILNEIQGVVATKPRPKFVGAFKQRKANLEGYITDPELTYTFLWDRISRKRYLEPFAKKAQNEVGKIKTQWLKQETQDYIDTVGGKYIDPVYFLGININTLAKRLNRIQAPLKLGYRPSTALINRLQNLQMGYSDIGSWLFYGSGKVLTKEGKQIIEELKINTQPTKVEVGDQVRFRVSRPGSQKGLRGLLKPLGLFSKAEVANRSELGVGSYYYARLKLKYDHDKSLQFAKDANSAHNLVYGTSDLGKIYRHPLGKTFGQFKTFSIGYLYNATNVLIGKPVGGMEQYFDDMFPTKQAKMKRAARFIGTNAAIGGARVALSPLFAIVMFLLLRGEDQEEPGWFRGVLSFVNIDISRRAGVNPADVLPTGDKFEDNDWLKFASIVGGPSGSDLILIQKYLKKYAETKDPKDLAKAIRISPAAWNMYQFLKLGEEQVVQPSDWEKALVGAGFVPKRFNMIKEGMVELSYFAPELKTANGLPTRQAIENMVNNLGDDKYDESKKKTIKMILREAHISEARYPEFVQSRKDRMDKPDSVWSKLTGDPSKGGFDDRINEALKQRDMDKARTISYEYNNILDKLLEKQGYKLDKEEREKVEDNKVRIGGLRKRKAWRDN